MKILSLTLTSFALFASAQAQQLWHEIPSTATHQDSFVMGDMDADGTSDFAFVRSVVHPSGFGTAYEIDFRSGATGVVLSTWVAPPNDSVVEVLGDLTGDGIAELILSRPLGGGQVGTVSVYNGATQAVMYNYSSGSGENDFGRALGDAGDVNADGTPDFIIGIPGYGTPGWDGRIRVYSGATGDLLYTRNGTAYSYYGWSVGSAGDVDADGHDDFMASARGTYSGQTAYPGFVRVYSGATGALLNQIPAANSEDANPFVLASAGDLDLDGHSDYMLGSPYSNINGGTSGEAVVYSGATHNVLWHVIGDPGSGMGADLLGLGDVSGDGFPDFAVGQGGTQGAGNWGAINVYSGASGEQIFRRTYYDTTGSPTTGQIGWGLSILRVGDWNGDGLDDLAYTLRGEDAMSQDFGSLRIEGNWFGGEGQHFCDTETNTTGEVCILQASTQASSPSGWHLDAMGGPPSEFAYFLMGTGINPTPIAIDAGSLCLGTAIGRYNHSGSNRMSIGMFNAGGDLVNLSGTSVSGMGFDVPQTLPLPGTPLIQSGETYHFQVWYRDLVGGVTTSNLSSGLSVEF